MEKTRKFMLLYKRCDMSKLVLYKNKDKVFEKEGTINNNLFNVENITFNLENNVLTREDDNFKYELDFINENALVLIKEKNYSWSAGQYFDVKIEYVELTPEEFEAKMVSYKETLDKLFAEGKSLEDEIKKQLEELKYE